MAKNWNMSIGLNQKKVLGAFNESSFSGMLTQLVSCKPEI